MLYERVGRLAVLIVSSHAVTQSSIAPRAPCPSLRRRRLSLALAGIVATAGCASTLGDLSVIGAESIPRDKPSTFICGNKPKSPPGPGECTHRTRHHGEATEVVDVRGWITWAASGPNNADPDYHYSLRLDPDNPPTILSHPTRPELVGTIVPLSRILHPGNLIEAVEEGGMRDLRHPDNDDVFVGNTLKIEIHGCATGGVDPGTPNRVLCSAGTNDAQTAPVDWVAVDEIDGDARIFWPFNPQQPLTSQPGPIQVGDYVRLVGTLWEDDPHQHGRCWGDDDEGGHGWYEVHPVDFMGKIPSFEPAPSQSTAQVIAACASGAVDVDLRPPMPRPPGAEPRYEEVITVDEGTRRSVTTHSDRITVHLDVGERFWGYYRVYWGAAPPPTNPPPPTDPPPAHCPRGQRCCEPVAGGCALCAPVGSPCP
jgi:hypothetical protein